MIQKKDSFEDRRGKVYEIVGKWCRDIVLSPIDVSDAECLIYASAELYELIETGHLKYMGGGK